jgi:hypothetical protein
MLERTKVTRRRGTQVLAHSSGKRVVAGAAYVLLIDLQSWWVASLGLDVFLALVIVEWLRAVGSRAMGTQYSSTLLPATADQLDGCLAQAAASMAALSAMLSAQRLRRATA